MPSCGGDLSGLQTALESSYRLPYTLDRGNSSIERASAKDSSTAFTLRAHFAVPKLPAPPVLPPGTLPGAATMPNPPRGVPDARSLFMSVTYNFAPLPAQPMRPRLADQRVGFFTSSYIDFGNDHQEGRRTHVIERWRLEKKDPQAAVSEPKEPIRVVMDRNIPERWREPLRAGILEWNKAFEKAGFRNAIAVEQQANDADWTAFEGTKLLAVRWFATDGPGATAVGPSQSDPRTGEILRGAAIIPENWVRIFRSRAGDTEPRLSNATTGTFAGGDFAKRYMQCNYADDMLEQTQFAMELLDARGSLNADSPEAEQFIAQSLKDVTMHEVGHALGLRHNFRSSTTVTEAQLRDANYTARHGVSNSVMDYNALNIPLTNERVADYHMVALGNYDFWAIEYGYRELAPEVEAAELSRIAGLSDRDPTLAYATDEDVIGTDPLVNQRDLGNDPLAFAQRQVKLTRELWQRTQARTLAADDDLTVYRRNLQRGFFNLNQALPMATKFVGGTFTSRTLAGSGQPLWVPVPAEKQRAALDLVVTELFNSASFRFDPKFMSRLGIDQLDRNRGANPDFSLGGAVAGLQRTALDGLMSEGLAQRLADAEAKVADPRSLLIYTEVQERLQRAIWSELGNKRGGDIDSLRRTLQREHLRRLGSGLLRPSSTATADVRSVSRQGALQLQTALKAALAAPGWSATARAHLDDSLATLSEALKATLSKQGV